MHAPSDFSPVNVMQQRQPPGASIPRYRKFDLYRDPNHFRYVDDHAVQVARMEHDSFRDLIWHLIYSQNLHSDLEKARAIFRWMTSKNMYTINFNHVDKGSPEEILLSFKNKKGTYARIFETMCGYAGMYCIVITGFAKGLDYRPGDKFPGTEYNHSWNALYLEDSWYLVDSHWATRYLVSDKNVPENLVYEYDDFYFLPDPEQLIYSHWSHRPEWQLLTRPLNLAEFEELPLVKSYFFKCGMYFRSHLKGVVKTENGRLGLSCGYMKPTCFTYKLTFAENNEEMYKGQKLKNYGLQETLDNAVTFYFRAPQAGAYYLTIFAQLLTGDIGVKNVFTASCEYKVVADRASGDSVFMPLCSDSNWGPAAPVQQLGLVPSQKDAVIPTSDGHVRLEFQRTRPANILCKLRKNDMNDDDLESYVQDREEGDKVIVEAKLPAKGEYGLEVYGNDPAKDGDTYTHICQYYIHFADPKDQKNAFYQESPELKMKQGNYDATLPAYIPGSENVSAGVANLNLQSRQGPPVAPKPAQGEFDDLPPPPPELLQQQYLYGTVPDSRQQAVHGNMAFPQGQSQVTYMPGRTDTAPQAQQAQLTSVPASTAPIQVQKRSMGQAPPSVPGDFKLVPVRGQNEEGPAPAPASRSQPKPSIELLDTKVLESVDDHAIQVSKSEHTSFRDLAWDLIYSQKITNDLEKVRIIFRWLASKNLKEMNFDKVDPGTPEEVLMGLKTGRTTYAMVLDVMCNYVGVHSKIISGYAKGADYRPGQKFTPGQNQHSWNAVFVYGTWCLIDAHWAARRIIGKQSESEEFHYQLDEYFFLPDPHQLIYTHFPDDAKWQLLERPITLDEFENMPHMKPQFFKYGLEFVSNRTAVIFARGEVNVRLRYPAHRLPVAFNFSIQFENGDEDYNGVKLNRYGMQESVGGIASFRLRLPVKASYILYIYAKEDTPENKDNVYAQVCEYKVVQDDVQSPEPLPFPPCAYLSWGPGSSFYKYGLATYQQTAQIISRQGKTELQVRIPRPIQFMAKLKHNEVSDAELEGYCMHRVVGNTAYFNITLPARGEYGLEIYANDPSIEGTTLYHVAQYLLECHEDVTAVPLPKLPAGYLGAQPKFSEFGLNTLSHHDPVIHLETNYVEIQLATAQEMRMTSNLISVKDEQEFPEYVFSQCQGSVVSFVINIPETGFFKLQLYAIPTSDTSQQLPGVYNYLINCQKLACKAYAFPKQYAQWKEGCYMFEPLVLHKELGVPVAKFRISIPKAEAVAIVADQEWTHLQPVEGQREIWEGQVPLANYYGKDCRVTLNSNYGGDKTSYSTLLEYKI